MDEYRFGETFDRSLAFENNYSRHRCKFASYFTLKDGIDCENWSPTITQPYYCKIGKDNCDRYIEIEKVKILKGEHK